MPVNTAELQIAWEKLPDNFILDEEPVENIDQPILAAALRESLEIARLISGQILVASNMGICATLNGKLAIKAPDWFYVRNAEPLANQELRRSYTPNLEGEIPAIVMEFLSATESDEYSSKQSYPPGKWFFYEQVLRVPFYAIFEPVEGLLEVYQLNSSGRYELQPPNANNHHWIAGVGLFLGVWQGTKANRTGYWLRWWDENAQMLLWGAETIEKERQEKDIIQQRAERLAAQLRAAGIEPEV
jgi:Uma2 family endonuclease